MINKNSLIVDIKSVASILNGEFPGVTGTNFRSDFVRARYGIILLAAISVSIFEDICIQANDSKFTKFYKLEKVAKGCDLIYDRGRTAEKVYRYLESKRRVQFLIQNNHTFITLTREGRRKYKERLKEFIELKSSTSCQGLEETERQTISLAKGVKIKPHRITNSKPISDNLDLTHEITQDNRQCLMQI